MRKLLAIALGTVVAGGCTTPMERAQDICNQLGDPSPACVERQFNIERAREDTFRAQELEKARSPSEPPTESQYDRIIRESKEKMKEECAKKGGRYTERERSASCQE